MISLDFLKISIPENRKPGKFLKKEITTELNLSDLVQSLPFGVSACENKAEYFKALDSCHSCQSNGIDVKDLFFEVWSSFPEVKFVVLHNERGIHARCVVNIQTKKFAPVYGNLHYLLQARLQFFGFQPGEIVPESEIEDLSFFKSVKIRSTKKDKSVFKSEESPICYKVLQVEKKRLEFASNLWRAESHDMNEAYTAWRETGCKNSSIFSLYYDLRQRARNARVEFLIVQKRVSTLEKRIRKQEKKQTTPGFYLRRYWDMAKKQVWKNEETSLYRSNFYLDSEGRFINVQETITAGYEYV